MNPSLYSEAAIADKLGITRDELQTVRVCLLKKDADWKKQGRHIALTDSGVKLIRTYFAKAGIEPPESFDDCLVAEKNGAGELIELTVLGLFPNTGLLRATTPDGEEVHVRVANNRNFRPKMLIKARPPDPRPAPQLYRLEGRCPRFPGRW